MDIEVNYKNKKRYKTAKYPLHQGIFWTWLIWVLSRIALMGKEYKIETIGMEDLKPPYMLLSNHMHFIDFELAAMATWPHPVSNVVSIDGYVIKWFLLEWIGAIATRKFTTDVHLVKSIRKVLQRGDILAMYPEARYTPCGTTAFLPDSLGKLIRMNKVPVVAVVHHGNHLYAPFWNFRKKRKVPLHTTFKLILTPEQIERGEYSFSDEVEVHSLPRVWRYIPLGKARLTHTPEDGFRLEGTYRDQRYHIHRQPAQTNSLHVEYDFGPLGKRDFVDISTENDSFYCCPTRKNVITKLAFATEEIYQRSQCRTKLHS